MELSVDSRINELDMQDEKSANEIDNVLVTIISSDKSDEYVHKNSYMSKDKNHKLVDRIHENHVRSRVKM